MNLEKAYELIIKTNAMLLKISKENLTIKRFIVERNLSGELEEWATEQLADMVEK